MQTVAELSVISTWKPRCHYLCSPDGMKMVHGEEGSTDYYTNAAKTGALGNGWFDRSCMLLASAANPHKRRGCGSLGLGQIPIGPQRTAVGIPAAIEKTLAKASPHCDLPDPVGGGTALGVRQHLQTLPFARKVMQPRAARSIT